MATRPFVRNDLIAPNSVVWTWVDLQITDDGVPAQMIYGEGQLWVQVSGAVGSGGTIVIEGSVNGDNYATMIMANNSAASFTALGGASLRGVPLLVRPRVTAGNAATNFTIHLAFAGGKLPG